MEQLGPTLGQVVGEEGLDPRAALDHLMLGPGKTADADLHEAAAALPEPPHDGAVRPAAAVQLVGQIGMGVDLHDRHVGRIVDQARHDAIGQQVLAAKRDEESLAEAGDRTGRRGQVFRQAVGGHRGIDLDRPRACAAAGVLRNR